MLRFSKILKLRKKERIDENFVELREKFIILKVQKLRFKYLL